MLCFVAAVVVFDIFNIDNIDLSQLASFYVSFTSSFGNVASSLHGWFDHQYKNVGNLDIWGAIPSLVNLCAMTADT